MHSSRFFSRFFAIFYCKKIHTKNGIGILRQSIGRLAMIDRSLMDSKVFHCLSCSDWRAFKKEFTGEKKFFMVINGGLCCDIFFDREKNAAGQKPYDVHTLEPWPWISKGNIVGSCFVFVMIQPLLTGVSLYVYEDMLQSLRTLFLLQNLRTLKIDTSRRQTDQTRSNPAYLWA